MKKAILILSVLLISISASSLFAQEIICKVNGDKITVKVIEITSDFVKYKKFNDPEGPLRNISIEEIEWIEYEDGAKEKFSTKEPSISEQQSSGKIPSSVAPHPKKKVIKKETKNFYIGPKIGINFSKWGGVENMFSQSDRIQKRLAGLSLGLRSELILGKYLAFQMEAMLNTRGFASHYEGDESLYLDYHQNYLEFAPLLKVQIGNEKLRGYLNSGVSLGYLVSGKIKTVTYQVSNGHISNIRPTEMGIFELHPGFGRFDVCFLAGAGLEMEVSNHKIFFDFRLSSGLTALKDKEDPWDFNPKNQSVSLSLGFLF